MTNTKFRKRALLSSVAMLLVALVALGSATFAWFNADPTADAKGLNVKASTSAGLVALSDTEALIEGQDYSHHTILNAVKTEGVVVTKAAAEILSPVSQNASGAMFTGSSASESDWEGNGAFVGTSNGFYSEGISLKVTGGATSANVKCAGVSWTAGSGNLSSAVRVSLFAGTTYIGTWAPSAVGSEKFIKQAGDYGDDIKDTRAALGQGIASTVTWEINDQGTAGKVTAYVYLNGEHEEVYSTNLTTADATLLANNIEIDFALAD